MLVLVCFVDLGETGVTNEQNRDSDYATRVGEASYDRLEARYLVTVVSEVCTLAVQQSLQLLLLRCVLPYPRSESHKKSNILSLRLRRGETAELFM
jgi:hypothetical protein